MSESGLLVVVALGKVILGCGLVFVTLRALRRWLGGLTSRTGTQTDDRLVSAVLRTAGPIGYLGALWWGWTSLAEDFDVFRSGDWTNRLIEGAVQLTAIVLIVRLINRVLLLLLDRALVRLGHENQLDLLRGLDPMIRSLVWILGLLVFLQNQGVQMGAIYASLAGAGIGIGLALKGPISNFLNYLTILLDEPFRIGDFICFDGFHGTVEGVGIRSTVLRSLSGERIVISNEDLLGKTIQNYGDLPKRRISTTLGLVYQTPVATLKSIPALIESVIQEHHPAEFDRCHFTRFAGSCLEFEFVYFVPNADIVLYLDLQQKINIGIMEVFQRHAIDFAYPTQTLFLEQPGETRGELVRPALA
ncbi:MULTISPECIES: mechanosensitive ion channel family protein [Aphanothece]|uniref:mechanosensitive ion channel family protein n=1 Tax=Aphanothece TaxID=1121 RepID=UPI0039847BA9